VVVPARRSDRVVTGCVPWIWFVAWRSWGRCCARWAWRG